MEIKLSKVLKRELKGRVLATVAKESGVPKSLLHDWVSVGRLPSGKNIGHLRKLAIYLSMTLEEMLFDCEEGKTVLASTTFTDNENQYRVNIEKLSKIRREK